MQEVTNDDTSNETFAAVPTYHMNNICPDDDEDFVDLDHHLKLRRSNQVVLSKFVCLLLK